MLCHHVDLGYPTKYFETYISDHEKNPLNNSYRIILPNYIKLC
jgi:hypothetical protein